MQRPEVTLENAENLYAYYENFEPSQLVTRLGHHALRLAAQPHVSVEPETRQELSQLFASGDQAVLMARHLHHLMDPPSLARLPVLVDELRPLIGNVFIYAKKALFASKTPVVGSLFRATIENLHAIPTFRTSDHGDEVDDHKIALQQRAYELLMGVGVSKMSRGLHVAGYPEGTHNEDYEGIMPLKRGFFDLVSRIKPRRDNSIFYVPITIDYASDHPSLRQLRRPYMHIGGIVEAAGEIETDKARVYEAMSQSLKSLRQDIY